MLADLKINPTLWKEVVTGKKKLIGRRTEKNIENVEAPNTTGEMSPKLKEQLNRLTRSSGPAYNEFGDIGDVTLQHQYDLTSLAAMVADKKL